MSIMKMTMLGLENGLKPTNESIFDLLTLPDGIDKDDLVDNIILEGGEFEVLYADPHFFRQAVYTWSRKHYRTFEKWITALNIEYNPLENYDRFEDYKDTGSENSNTKNSGTNSESSSSRTNDTGDYSEKESITEKIDEDVDEVIDHKIEGESEDRVSAYDSDYYQPSKRTNTASDDDTDRTTERDMNRRFDRDTSGSTKNDSSNSSNTSGNTTANEDYTKGTELSHVGRIHGNIGVTTSQQMLQSELDIARFNIIQQITDLFLTEFTLMVYT